ncbi:MAG: flagellar basal body rod protein FlgB [Campylobacterota bacterium]
MQISEARTLAQEALDYRSIRQDLIAGNIANVDTPFYKPRDISFEQMLSQKRAEQKGDNSFKLNMAHTNSMHLEPKDIAQKDKASVFFRDGHMARNDGNSVDIDTETTELSKNGMMYEGLLAALKKDKAIFTSVIESSGRI